MSTTNTFECPFCGEEECDNSIKITCPHCHYFCCLDCAERYLINQKVAYICPNPDCKKGWDFTFIYKNFPKEFIEIDLKKSYAEMCYTIDTQQFLPHYIAEVDFCKKLNKVYQILIDNNVDFEKVYSELEIKGTSDDEIAKLKANKLQILVDNHALVKDYIDNIDLFAKIFAINYHDDMYSLYLYYNYFKNSSIKDNYENIVNHYHYKTCDFHEWFESKYNIMNDQEQDATEADLDTKNYFIKEIFKDMSKRTFQQNYENVKDIIKRLNIKYVEDSNRHYKIGACDNPSCDGNIYHYNEHVVCNMCQRVYCPKCRKEIYPELVERMIDYQIELIPNPLYSKYTDEQKKEKHVCKQEDIDQVRLLTENIKKCPNPECREPIYKDGGCDHMWCSKCHTMFNWSTGEITKTTTNPHYFQWLRQTGQAVPRYNHPDADPYYNCNEQLNREQCNKVVDRYVKNDTLKFKNFASAIELKMIENNNDEMSATRAEYAYGVIDNKEFAYKISTHYMDKFFIDNYNMIVINTIYMISEFFRNISHDQKVSDETSTMMKNIIDIHNEGVKNIYDMYPSLKVQLIDVDDCKPIFIN